MLANPGPRNRPRLSPHPETSTMSNDETTGRRSAARRRTVDVAPRQDPAPPAQQHVLVVDDYEDSRTMCTEYLEFMGYRVSGAGDGREAVSKAHDRPDLILMDLSLPRMDGWDAIRQLKQDRVTRDIPIIVLTGHALTGLRERAIAAGCDSFLTKPCLPQDILEEVRKVLKKRAAPPEKVTARRRRSAT
jgi:two-component system, cell cycle response regulator DivK